MQGVGRKGEWEGGRDRDGRVSGRDEMGMGGGEGIEDGVRKEGRVGRGGRMGKG